MKRIVQRLLIFMLAYTVFRVGSTGAEPKEVVPIMNCTNYVLYGTIVPAELKLMNRHMDLHDSASTVKVWVIPPFKTANIELPTRALTKYDRDLWLTHRIDDMKSVFSTKTRSGLESVVSFNIGSSKAKRFIGFKENRLAIFSSQNAAERAMGLSDAAKKDAPSKNAQSKPYSIEIFNKQKASPLPKQRYPLPDDTLSSADGGARGLADTAAALRKKYSDQ